MTRADPYVCDSCRATVGPFRCPICGEGHLDAGASSGPLREEIRHLRSVGGELHEEVTNLRPYKARTLHLERSSTMQGEELIRLRSQDRERDLSENQKLASLRSLLEASELARLGARDEVSRLRLQRQAAMRALRASGMTLAEIGRVFELSRERVRQVLSKSLPG